MSIPYFPVDYFPADYFGGYAGAVDPPEASIVSIVPDGSNPEGTPITFTGSSTPGDFPVDTFHWESDIDGEFGTTEIVTDFAGLSVGSHTIRFFVVDTDGNASAPDTYPTPLVVESTGNDIWVLTPINQFVVS